MAGVDEKCAEMCAAADPHEEDSGKGRWNGMARPGVCVGGGWWSAMFGYSAENLGEPGMEWAAGWFWWCEVAVFQGLVDDVDGFAATRFFLAGGHSADCIYFKIGEAA